MITNKIKSLLAFRGFNFSNYANHLSITKQSLNNKSKRNAYKINDLIKLAELTNTTLAFNDKDTNKPLIEFDTNDIKENTNKE